MTELFKYYSLVSGFPTLLVIIEFFYFLRRDRRLLAWGTFALEVMILVVPLMLLRIFEAECRLKAGTVLFTPTYGYFVYALIVLCQLAYFYCSYRQRILSPFPEVLINCLVLTGVIMNILIAIRLASLPGILTICLPAAMLFILMLVNNHRLMTKRTTGSLAVTARLRPRWSVSKQLRRRSPSLDVFGDGLFLRATHLRYTITLEDVDEYLQEPVPRGRLSSTCLFLLQMRPVGKFLLLGTLCIPVLVLLIKIMLL